MPDLVLADCFLGMLNPLVFVSKPFFAARAGAYGYLFHSLEGSYLRVSPPPLCLNPEVRC